MTSWVEYILYCGGRRISADGKPLHREDVASYDVVNCSDAETQLRLSACKVFNSTESDINEDGKISKEGYHMARDGDPWTIVAFSAVDIDRDGEMTRDEFEQT